MPNGIFKCIQVPVRKWAQEHLLIARSQYIGVFVPGRQHSGRKLRVSWSKMLNRKGIIQLCIAQESLGMSLMLDEILLCLGLITT